MSEVVPSQPDPWAALEPAARPKPGKRVRIVLAERRRTRRVVRTLAEVEEQTDVGEVWVNQLVKEQRNLALRLGALTLAVLGAIPVVFALVPAIGTISVLGLRLTWLLLGFGVYPFLLGVAWSYNRGAERAERDFINMIDS